jgi:hypothetical protein
MISSETVSADPITVAVPIVYETLITGPLPRVVKNSWEDWRRGREAFETYSDGSGVTWRWQPVVQSEQLAQHEGAPTALKAIVGALAFLLAVLVAGLVMTHLRPSWFVGLRNSANLSTAAPPHISSAPRTPQRPVASQVAVISSVRPDTANPGQTVELSGTRFMSANGSIVAYFGSAAAPTRCPTSTRCLAVVPPNPSRTPIVRVRLRIDNAFSNAQTFRYR